MSTVTITNIKQFTQSQAVKLLRRLSNDLAVVQKEQVAEAFKNSGQPGKKWPPLWADSFVGKVPWKKQGTLINAQTAFFYAMHARNPDSMKIVKAQARVQKANEQLIAATSYRKGGKPLWDKGALAASFFTKYNFVFEAELALLVVIASSSFLAPFHQKGFRTNGPNFIPLNLKAARMHVKGANPKDEGLEYGVDYIMAWKGVKVPERAMVDYADPANKKQIEDTITARAKG